MKKKIIQKFTYISNEQNFNGPPTNCNDLNLLGKKIIGFYLVKDS